MTICHAISLVTKVEHHARELFPRVGLVVTNLTLASRAVVRFYNKRGAAEVAAATIKEGKQAVRMARRSHGQCSPDRAFFP